MIRHEDGKWVLYTRDGKRVLGTHDSKEEAIAQEQAILHAQAQRLKKAVAELIAAVRKWFRR
jgi:hypothetical protein